MQFSHSIMKILKFFRQINLWLSFCFPFSTEMCADKGTSDSICIHSQVNICTLVRWHSDVCFFVFLTSFLPELDKNKLLKRIIHFFYISSAGAFIPSLFFHNCGLPLVTSYFSSANQWLLSHIWRRICLCDCMRNITTVTFSKKNLHL